MVERVWGREGGHRASDLLRCLVAWIRERGETLDWPDEKESHPGKSLSQHVEECWNLADSVLHELGLASEELRQFCLSLCVAHDLGKLSPRWKLGKEGRHSLESFRLLEHVRNSRGAGRLLPGDYWPALLFGVLKHHSSLSVDLEKFESKCYSELSKLLEGGVHTSLDIADVIGVFKLADIASAANYPPDIILSQFRWSERFEENIEVEIKRVAEGKRGFDAEKFALQNTIATSSGKHLIVAAPTGWGKTALALLRAKSLRPCKIFYVLPTITAIRKFEQALRSIFGRDYVGEYFYFADVEYLARRGDHRDEQMYPIDFYRFFVPKVVVTTIDQLLLTTLQLGRYHLRRFNLRRSLLVLDEYHLLTPQMIGALRAVFEILGDSYSFSVLLMSATPSRVYTDALGKTLEVKEPLVLEQEYRRLSRHRVELRDEPLLDFLREKAGELKGRRVLVIANTIERAVKAYDLARREFGPGVRLIHGRFAYTDRARKEDKVDEAEVLVSTQVAEVSLDVSFDVLVTELAPVPSLVQRMGRVNRYGRSACETNVYVCLKLDSYSPYTLLEMLATEEILHEGVFQYDLAKGEAVYLDVLDSYFRKLMVKAGGKTEEVYRHVRKRLEDVAYFLSLKEEFEKFSEYFGREPSYLAVPQPYRSVVKQLWKKTKGRRSYEERRRLLAEMKSYFISVPRFIEDREWDDELNLYVVGVRDYVYDREKGLIPRELVEA
ncbi:MAG: CRISPR-associated helicase Cas3' [Thermofilaceae archaeon]